MNEKTYKAKITIYRNWVTFENDDQRGEKDLADIGHEWAAIIMKKLEKRGFTCDVKLGHGNDPAVNVYADVEGVTFRPTGMMFDSIFDTSPSYHKGRLAARLEEMDCEAREDNQEFDCDANKAAIIDAAHKAFKAVDVVLTGGDFGF